LHPGIPTVEVWNALFPGRPVPETLRVNYCGMFYVTRDRVRQHPRSLYLVLLDLLLGNPLVGYSLERLWGALFHKLASPQEREDS
jgi:hypothetical protein